MTAMFMKLWKRWGLRSTEPTAPSLHINDHGAALEILGKGCRTHELYVPNAFRGQPRLVVLFRYGSVYVAKEDSAQVMYSWLSEYPFSVPFWCELSLNRDLLWFHRSHLATAVSIALDHGYNVCVL